MLEGPRGARTCGRGTSLTLPSTATPMDVLTVDVVTGRWRRTPWGHPTIANGLLAGLLLGAWRRPGPPPVVLAGGGVSGHPVVAGATAVVCGRSPQSGGLAEARVEGRLAGGLRAAGTTAVVLHGQTAQPVVVSLAGPEPQVLDARELSGMDAAATTNALKERFPADCVVGVTGVAGEHCSALASIVFDYGFSTATGGLGGALGRLGVKALVLPPPAPAGDAELALTALTESYAVRIDANPLARSQRDAPGFGVWVEPGLAGYLGALNFTADQAPNIEEQAGERFLSWLKQADPSCPGCPQDCIKRYPAGDSHPECGRLHQLALPVWASHLGMPNPRSGLSFNAECHRYGLEHLAVGAMLGALAEADSSGMTRAANNAPSRPTMSFGDNASALALVQRWGNDPRAVPGGSGRLDDFAVVTGCTDTMMAIKNMPMPPIDPRGSQGLGVAMALNPTGPLYDVVEHDIDFDLEVAWPRHVARGRAYGVPPSGLRMGTLDTARVRSVILLWQLWSGLGALGVCLFASPPTRELDEQQVTTLTSRTTGVDLSFDQVLRRGRQRLAVQRRLNHRWGVGESTERLPDRFHDRPVRTGRLAGAVVDRGDFHQAARAIREHFGWGDVVGGSEDRGGLADLVGAVATLERDR